MLPTRLRGSETIPEMFKPRKVHAVVPMKNGKSNLPRLGTGRKKEKKEDSRKPYSVRGGVKKLLQRRKMEEEEKERADHVMNVSDQNVGDDPTPTSIAASVTSPLSESNLPHSVYTRETSSLRVGRNRINRPDLTTTVRPLRTKFSAAFEDDEPAEQREQVSQRRETKSTFEMPKDFTFSRDVSFFLTLISPAKCFSLDNLRRGCCAAATYQRAADPCFTILFDARFTEARFPNCPGRADTTTYFPSHNPEPPHSTKDQFFPWNS